MRLNMDKMKKQMHFSGLSAFNKNSPDPAKSEEFQFEDPSADKKPSIKTLIEVV